MTSIKTNKILSLICGLFIFLFVYTAISKFREFHSFKSVLAKSPLVGNYSELVAWILPSIELLVALVLFIPNTRQAGLLGSLVLMSLFTVYVGYMIIFVPHLPCSCGGVISGLSWKEHLFFNFFFMMLALAGILLQKRSEIFIRINRTSRTPV
jgi:putative oxidoreductase